MTVPAFAYPLDDLAAQSDGKFTWSFINQCWIQSDVSAAGEILIPIALPDNPRAALAGVLFRLVGSRGAAHAGLPATLPHAQIYRQDDSGLVNVASAVDASANVAAYDAAHDVFVATPRAFVDPHAVGFGGLAIPPIEICTEVPDGIHRYLARLQGETGANSAANKLSIVSVTAWWQTLSIGDSAAERQV